jgi:hypothetical protein
MNNKNATYLLSIISTFIFMYYYFSFDLISHFLGCYNLDLTSVISWEDVQFSFVSILLKPILFFFLIFFGIATFIIPIWQKQGISFQRLVDLKTRFNQKTKKLAWKKIFLRGFLIFTGGIIGIYFVFTTKSTIITSFWLLAAACFAYYLHKNIELILISLVFVFMTLYCNDRKGKATSIYDNDIKLDLLDGEIVKSDANHQLIFLGTKYVIIQTDSINAKLYPTNRIKEIEWIRKSK